MDIFTARIAQLRTRARNQAATTIRYANPGAIEDALRMAMNILVWEDNIDRYITKKERRDILERALAELSPIRRAQDELARNDPE
jgi:hypothetical protein